MPALVPKIIRAQRLAFITKYTRKMKNNIWFAVLLVPVVAAITLGCSTAQPAASARPDSAFIFEVQTVNPLGGSARQITGDYSLKFAKDRVEADLPYFGRVYSAPTNPAGGGIRLNTSDFRYEPKETRKGWEIVIRPDSQQDIQMMVLSVSQNGFGTLQVTSTNRQRISYYGRVRQNGLVNN